MTRLLILQVADIFTWHLVIIINLPHLLGMFVLEIKNLEFRFLQVLATDSLDRSLKYISP